MKVVVVGASSAGLKAVRLLDELKAASEIVVISPTSKYYFNIGAPRLLVSPELAKEVVHELGPILKKSKNTSLVTGLVTRVDFDNQSLTVENDGSERDVTYDKLILATGAAAHHDAFKARGDPAVSISSAKSLSEEIKNSQTIAVVGGGPTGVETASEIKDYYRDKTVTLYTGSHQPLPALDVKRGKSATSKLQNLGVKIVNNVKFTDVEKVNGSNQYKLSLSDGTTQTVDCYIPAYGVNPNTDWLDRSILDSKGFVVTDEYLRVKGCDNAYALGDVVSGCGLSAVDILYNQLPTLKATLNHDLVDKSAQLKPYKRATRESIIVPISKSGGVGLVYGIGLPNFVVRMAKAKDYMIPKAREMLM